MVESERKIGETGNEREGRAGELTTFTINVSTAATPTTTAPPTTVRPFKSTRERVSGKERGKEGDREIERESVCVSV